MKRLLLLAAVFVGLGTATAHAAPCDQYQWQSRVKNSLNSAYACNTSTWVGNGMPELYNPNCTVSGQPTAFRVKNPVNMAQNGQPTNVCRVTTFRAKKTNGVPGTYCDWLYNHCIVEPWSTSCAAVTIRNSCPPHW